MRPHKVLIAHVLNVQLPYSLWFSWTFIFANFVMHSLPGHLFSRYSFLNCHARVGVVGCNLQSLQKAELI